MFVSPALAATITVNTTADRSASANECQGNPGDECSLREAIATARAGDTVSVPASPTPYLITLGQLAPTKALTIDGAGARTTPIRGNGSSRIFDASTLPAGSTVTISGVTISGGSATEGGALRFDSSGATMVLNGVALTGNTATSGQGRSTRCPEP